MEKIPWRREWQLTPIFLLEKFRGERRLVDDNPWDHKESHMTEHERRIFYYHSVHYWPVIDENRFYWGMYLWELNLQKADLVTKG